MDGIHKNGYDQYWRSGKDQDESELIKSRAARHNKDILAKRKKPLNMPILSPRRSTANLDLPKHSNESPAVRLPDVVKAVGRLTVEE